MSQIHLVGKKMCLADAVCNLDRVTGDRTGKMLLGALYTAMVKARELTGDTTVQAWVRHDSYADVSGLRIECLQKHTGRLVRWTEKYIQSVTKNSQRCTDWNSFYQFKMIDHDEEGVTVMTSSYNIGD